MLIILICLAFLEFEQALNVAREDALVLHRLQVHALAFLLAHSLDKSHALVDRLPVYRRRTLLQLLHEHARLVKLGLLLFHLLVDLRTIRRVYLLMLLDHVLGSLLLLEVRCLVKLVNELLGGRLQLLSLLHHHELLVLVLQLRRPQELLQVANLFDVHLLQVQFNRVVAALNLLLLVLVGADLLELWPRGQEAEHLRQVTIYCFNLSAQIQLFLLLLNLPRFVDAALTVVVQFAAPGFA